MMCCRRELTQTEVFIKRPRGHYILPLSRSLYDISPTLIIVRCVLKSYNSFTNAERAGLIDKCTANRHRAHSTVRVRNRVL